MLLYTVLQYYKENSSDQLITGEGTVLGLTAQYVFWCLNILYCYMQLVLKNQLNDTCEKNIPNAECFSYPHIPHTCVYIKERRGYHHTLNDFEFIIMGLRKLSLGVLTLLLLTCKIIVCQGLFLRESKKIYACSYFLSCIVISLISCAFNIIF